MLRRALIAAAPLALFATAARAAGKSAEKAPAPGQYVDLSPVALPVAVDGQVANYIFVYVRVNLAPKADLIRLRAKEPYFRDALVRAGHRTPFTDPNSFLRVDEAKLSAALHREAAAIAGAQNIKSVTVLSQAPKRKMGVPRPRPARS